MVKSIVNAFVNLYYYFSCLNHLPLCVKSSQVTFIVFTHIVFTIAIVSKQLYSNIIQSLHRQEEILEENSVIIQLK